MRFWRTILLGILAIGLGGPALFWLLAPLDTGATPGILTPLKLLRARWDPAYCLASLPDAAVLPPVVGEGACGIAHPVQLRGGIVLMHPNVPVMACPLALSYAVWERHSLRPLARDMLGSDVAGVEHLGVYNCRNVRNSSVWLSQHATGQALDASAIRLQNGRRISVAGAWGNTDAAGDFLRAAHQAACGVFKVTLGPEYNALHRDHFHLDTGWMLRCK